MPKISVVMPVYNRQDYLAEAIDSILNQTERDFEFIIIDDCSTDNTAKIIESYKDKRIVLCPNAKKSYVSVSRNRGIKLAKGKYIAFMDSDDISLPSRLERQVEYMDNNKNCSVLGSFILRFSSTDMHEASFPISDSDIKVRLLYACPISNPTAFMRSSVIKESRILHDENLEICVDYGFWVDSMPYVNFYNLPKVLLHYRNSPNNMTASTINDPVAVLRRQEVIRGIHKKALANFGFSLSQNDITLYNKVVGERNLPTPDLQTFLLFRELMYKLIEQYDGVLVNKDIFKTNITNMIISRTKRFGFNI